MEKILKLYTYVDGTNDTPFPSADEQVIIGSFTYTANRMGSAPQIAATVKHRLCLDDIWNDKVYAEFNGEKYFVINTPSSSKSNDDTRYEHDLELLSEREILNHVYFIDAVQGDSDTDVYKSNSTSVLFYGNIQQFVARLNSSLSYSGLDYTAVIDEGISSEDKQVSFEDKYILEALQEEFNIFEIPYYFVGKVIHFGYTSGAITKVLKYGHDDALLSISKENANYQLINRITGTGSSDNIPYYYPNPTPKGYISAKANPNNTGITNSDIILSDANKFSDAISDGTDVEYGKSELTFKNSYYNEQIDESKFVAHAYNQETDYAVCMGNVGYQTFWFTYVLDLKSGSKIAFKRTVYKDSGNGFEEMPIMGYWEQIKLINSEGVEQEEVTNENDNLIFYNLQKGENYNIYVYVSIPDPEEGDKIRLKIDFPDVYYWMYNGSEVNLLDIGVSLSEDASPAPGDSLFLNVDHYIPVSKNLMPSIYRESYGAQRFYNAKNNTYKNEEDEYYEFENEYSVKNIREGITTFEDIKPTIVGIENASGQRIDSFIEFAYDEKDNDEVDPNTNEYLHPYFFAKLRKFDGEYGFNLFEHAIEQQTMQISFTSGICGACTFEIGVGKDTQKNIVQVSDSGALLRDEEGNVLRSGEPQDRQNDTKNYEVWIALKKDDSTYPQIMPNRNYNYYPSTNDTFVILGINLPNAYILNAENKLKDSLIQYMWENNVEKFTFSINFSRIFFNENPSILSQLDENARVILEYDNKQHTLYIDNYTYKMDSNSPLPEIEVNLVDTLNIGQNSLQAKLDGVKQDILSSMRGGDILRMGLRYFLRKDVQDTASEKITFLKGIDIGSFAQYSGGGTFRVLKDLSTYAEVDRLRVRLKAYFETLEIINANSVGGKMIITPGGSIYVREVQDRDDDTSVWNYYRCYFLTEQDGQKVENRFKVGDLAISQSFNLTSGTTVNSANHYYWREVVGVGEDYIDLSKSICDTGSAVPAVNDTICQLGNRTDEDRQGALIFSSVDVFSPSITLYYGINDFSYVNKDYVSFGVDKTTGNAFFRVYGESYTGARDQSTYIKYTPENGVEIKGKFLNTAGNNIEDIINNIQNQVDGNIETWFGEEEPTLSNEPAINWTTDDDKNTHLGDLYYSDAGVAYRFQMEGAQYVWKMLKDSDITKALADAKAAKDAADAAQDAADAAADRLTAWASDGVISPTEKQGIKDEIARIDADKANITAQYTKYGLGTPTAFNNAYTAYRAVLVSLSASTPENIAIPSDFSSKQTYYYNERTSALGAIADASITSVNNVTEQLEQMQQDFAEVKQDVAGVKTSVDGLKNFTDEAFADGIVDRNESAAIASHINSIETFAKDAAESYTKVYENTLLTGTAKTNLANAYTAFTTAKTELVTTINGAIADGLVDALEKSAVDGKYTAFNTKYGDFVANLNASNRAIQDAINQNALQALQKIGELDYLKAALKEFTTIEGGLIQSSTLALGYTSDSGYQIMAGTNGIYDASKLGGGIASWWGGAMFDRFEYTEETMPENVASALVRMDGTGYFAKGNLWWESDGTLHADPLSFFVGPDSVGDVLGLFQFVKSGEEIEYAIPKYPFQKLEIGNYLQIGKAQLYWDEENQAFYVRHQDGVSPVGFYATGFISAKGANPNAGGSVVGVTKLSELDDVSLGTLSGNQVLSWNGTSWTNVDMPAGGASSWDEISGTPTTLSGYGITDAVTLTTEQTITGSKTFNEPPVVNKAGVISKFDVDTSRVVNGVVWKDTSSASIALLSYHNTVKRLFLNPQVDAITDFWADAVGKYNLVVGVDELKYNTYPILHSHNYASYVTKIGTATVGSPSKPVYLNAGVPTAFASTIGASNRPVYVNAGTITACGYTFGNASGNVPVNNGTLNTNLYAQYAEGLAPFVGISNMDTFRRNGIGSWSVNTENAPADYGVFLQISNSKTPAAGTAQHWINQIGWSTGGVIYARSITNTGSWSAWRSIAFHDSNVASATKLQTSRTLWGRPFNGTANVSGNMTGVGTITSSGGIAKSWTDVWSGGGTNHPWYGLSLNGQANNYQVTLSGYYGMTFHTLSGWLTMLGNGNVGIGTTSPSYKLHVAGTGYFSGAVTASGTLTVTGAITGNSTITASGLITAAGGVKGISGEYNKSLESRREGSSGAYLTFSNTEAGQLGCIGVPGLGAASYPGEPVFIKGTDSENPAKILLSTDNVSSFGWKGLTPYVYDEENGTRYYCHRIIRLNPPSSSNNQRVVLSIRSSGDTNYPYYGEWRLFVSLYKNYGEDVDGTEMDYTSSIRLLQTVPGNVTLTLYKDADGYLWIKSNAQWNSFLQYRVDYLNVGPEREAENEILFSHDEIIKSETIPAITTPGTDGEEDVVTPVGIVLTATDACVWRNSTSTTSYNGKQKIIGTVSASVGFSADSYIEIGDGRIRWDSAENALYVEKSDGTAIGFYSKGFMSAKGANDDAGGSVVGVTALSELSDVSITPGTLSNNDMLRWNGSKWVAVAMSDITPDLSGYATQGWATSQFAYKTGTNATGTWPISISGNANTLDNYHETSFFRSYVSTLANQTITNIPANRSGSYILTQGGWNGSAFVFYAGSSNSTMAFMIKGGQSANVNLLTTTDSTSSRWTDRGVLLTTLNYTSTLDSRYLRTVSLATISDLHSSWDALLKIAPSVYVTRWPTAAEVGALTQTAGDARYALKTGTNANGTWGIGISGNAATASKWATARTLTLTGAVTGSVSIDGSGNVSLATTYATGNIGALDTRYVKKSGDTMTGALTFQTSTQAYDPAGILYENNSGRIGCSLVGGLGLYAKDKLYFRPGWTSSSSTTYGVVIGSDTFTYNSNKIWHAGNDGSGSGLDADLLDGTHKSGLLTSVSSSSVTNLSIVVGGTTKSVADLYATYASQLLTSRTLWGRPFNGTANVSGNMTGVGTITSSGGIAKSWTDVWSGGGTNHPWYGLSLNGQANNYQVTLSGYYGMTFHTSSGWLTMLGNGYVGIGTTSPSYKLHVAGTVYSSSTVYAKTGLYSDGYVSAKGQNTSSDLRLKNKISDIHLSLKQIAAAPSMLFSWKESGLRDVGSSAQYWKNILPDAVKERDGWLEMSYGNIALVSVITVARELETVEEKIKRLERENMKLKQRINQLERRIAA